jgi:hypothetical protein
VCSGEEWRGQVGHGFYGVVRLCVAGHGLCGLAGCGLVGFGLVRHGIYGGARYGGVGRGKAWFIWLGLARWAEERWGVARFVL